MTVKGATDNRYTPEERKLGLTVTAAHNGNTRKASAALAEEGITISKWTLRSWKDNYPEMYLECREVVLPGLKAQMSEQLEAVALRASRNQITALDQQHTALENEEIETKDLPKVIQSASFAGGVAVSRSAELRGEGLLITSAPDPKAVEKALIRMGVLEAEKVVDVTDVQVIEEKA